MNGYEFAQQYYKRLADGEDVHKVNSESIINGIRTLGNSDCPESFTDGIDYTWAPKTITVTIPAPMTEWPKVGDRYYFRDDWDSWAGDMCDEIRFTEGPVWATRKDRDEAMRILKGGKSEA